eukprot:TRINITY_DN5497_c0_g1_i2.p1 TRINITY_DN5497_c0_g1~~TRINITY_DN5497_c0_g1_i2.p1  ORF type:complete len:430 (+),score=47.97 TRINITY_DN5497_c0_g1_i2:116-1291(+)
MPFSSGQHFTVASKLYCDLCRYIAEDAPVEDPRSKRHSGIQLCCECNTRLSVCLIEEKPYCGPCRAVVLSKKPKAAATNVVEQATNLEGTCEGCHKQLSGVCLEGLGKSWHERCFICVACKQPFIFSRAFVAVDNKPFCPECNQRREAGESAQIGSHNSTVPPPLITADSKKKLLDPGKCPRCGDHLAGGSTACTTCAKQNSPSTSLRARLPSGSGLFSSLSGSSNKETRCEKCTNSIANGSQILVAGKTYHAECFSCHMCSKPLQLSDYATVNGSYFCNACSLLARKQNREKKAAEIAAAAAAAGSPAASVTSQTPAPLSPATVPAASPSAPPRALSPPPQSHPQTSVAPTSENDCRACRLPILNPTMKTSTTIGVFHTSCLRAPRAEVL